MNTEVIMYLDGRRLARAKMANVPRQGEAVTLSGGAAVLRCTVRQVSWTLLQGQEPIASIELEES